MLDEDTFNVCCHCCQKIRRNGRVVACYVCRGIFHLKCTLLSLKDFKHLKSERTWNCCSCADIFPFNTIETDELLQLTFNSNLSCLCTNNISLADLSAFEYISGTNNTPNLNGIDPESNVQSRVNFDYCTPHQFHSSSNITNSSSEKVYSVFHSNIRSVQKNIDKLHRLLYDINYAFDIIGITETWIRSKCTDNIIVNIDLPGYTFLSQPTQQRVGGVGVYIKNSLTFHSRDVLNLCTTECETLWIEIENQLDKNIICCIIYRHPNSNLECFLNQLFTLIEKANTENKYCFLLGDFNINLLNYDTHTQTEDFINILNSYFFEPHIIKPTRITDHTATLIDNIFFNSVDFDAISGNLIFDLTDHLSNLLIINDLKTSSKKECLYRRDFFHF